MAVKYSNMHDAKSQLSQLVAEVLEGDEVVLAKAGKPLVRMVPYQAVPASRKPGYWKGKAKMLSGFDEYLDPSDLIPSLKNDCLKNA